MTTSSNDNPQAGAGRPLPKKEADLFKSLVKHYEMKQYKKAVKAADAVLKKYPNHGETLAMKGLTLNYMGAKDRKAEAHDLVKLGLRNDMRSHVCWHVYGLLYRSDRDYNEAIKAYKQALKIDPENLQILRDLSMLQVQMRDLSGFVVTRNTLLSLKPNGKNNWLAFALANHLSGQLEDAVRVVDTYLGTLTEGTEELSRGFESSELALYKNSILAQMGDYAAALEHLNSCESIVVDRGAWLLTRAEYLLRLKDYETARQAVLTIFQRGMTENHKAHSMYMCALLEMDPSILDEVLKLRGTNTLATLMPLSEEQRRTLRDAYSTELEPAFARSHAIQRIPYTLMEGDELRRVLDLRCRRDLSKGVPSLCDELISFVRLEKNGRYVTPADPIDFKSHTVFNMLEDMADGYVKSLESDEKFAPGDETEESPSTILWAWYLRACLHEVVGEYSAGIALMDKCLEHTPTAVDMYELKGRLLKASGDIKAAAECLDQGRDLDRQDRYINNMTTKYMLQAGMEDEAMKRIGMFTRQEGNPEQNLFEMQCCWYELEMAAAMERKKDWGRSLKKYSAIVKHFADFNEDQFDFHAYCIRKVTLRAYVSVLRFEDELYGHTFYCEAAAGIIRIYLHLFENPVSDETEEPDYSKMTAAERKKAKAIARKKKKALEKKEAEQKEKMAANGNSKKGAKPGIVDEDPLGKEFLKKDPLEEAKKYSAVLASYAPRNLSTWMLQYDVAVRRKKPLMALQALHKARSIDPDSYELFSRIVDFAQRVDSFTDVPDAVKTVLVDDTPPLLNKLSVDDFVKSAHERVKSGAESDLPTRVAVAKTILDTKTGSVAGAASLIVDGGMDSRGVSVATCLDALTLLKSLGDEATDATTTWKTAVKEKYPLISSLD